MLPRHARGAHDKRLALWGLRNNHADDSDYRGTVQASSTAGAATRAQPPTGDPAIDTLLAQATP